MPLPLLLGVSAAAVFANSMYRNELKEQDKRRRYGLISNDAIGRYPCDSLPSDKSVTLELGNIVCCGVYNGFIHTGLVIDDNLILELHGSGLSRAVSYKRFLANRSGNNIFVASDQTGSSFNFTFDDDHVASQLFAYHPYHVSKRNCYSHTWFCITGEMKPFASFEVFNEQLRKIVNFSLYWDKAKF